VSHGLSDTLKRLSRDSGLGVKVYAEKIPFEGNSFAFGKEMDIDPVSAAMNGGDDMRLLFVVPILSAEKFRREFQTFDIIGHMAQPEVGAVLVTPEGVELPVKAQGWRNEE
jgi:thiamine-monophosphate kinase